MDNVRTILADLPNTIGGYTILDTDGFYTIVLNQNLTRERNLISYAHEIDHIRRKDYESKQSVGLIEFYAHMKGDNT